MSSRSGRTRAAPPAVGGANLGVAWWTIAAGMALGAVLGLWSFGGPLAPPPGFREFDALPRRLVRLAHIAAVALPVLNLLYVPAIRGSRWSARIQRRGCRLLLLGTLGLPALLVATAVRPGIGGLLPLPVGALIGAVVLLAAGLPARRPPPGEEEPS
jgi:hypothetical protein